MADTPQPFEDLLGRAQRRHLPPPAARRAVRMGAGLTVVDIAEALGVTRQAVHHWETGNREPRGGLRERYAELLRALQRQLAS